MNHVLTGRPLDLAAIERIVERDVRGVEFCGIVVAAISEDGPDFADHCRAWKIVYPTRRRDFRRYRRLGRDWAWHEPTDSYGDNLHDRMPVLVDALFEAELADGSESWMYDCVIVPLTE